ncbi:MAG: T9SS type A sorting domain-containing protein [Bacteroidetes bacterium]|nr:T9SS type A sorting domain-containing protein [Bacteroidota bacterium]
MVKNFDWRNRHGANRLGSKYYDNDITGTGWMTKAKDQGMCGSCYAFGPIGALEGYINLYFNQHLDFNLSEQEIVCFSQESNGCDGGSPPFVFLYLHDPGVKTENCFPYYATGDQATCISLNNQCNADTVVKIDNYHFIQPSESTEIMKKLITNGPLSVTFTPQKGSNHNVVLTGYIVDPVDLSIIWIFKNSKGPNYGENGFEYAKIALKPPKTYISGAITVICSIPPARQWHDYDEDGYYYWGIGEKPFDCPGEKDEEDCDDSNPMLGPYDTETFYCECLLDYIPTPEHISSNTTWSENISINRDIVIDSSVTLTITDTVLFAPETKLIVLPGATLEIDGGTLTKACTENWQGIEVWGNPEESQFYEESQGRVLISNNGSIQNAITGIVTGKKVIGNYIQGFEGGLIIAREALFLNNNTSIEFHPYQNIHPFIPEHEENNFSYFTKCMFETDYIAFLEYGLPGVQVSLEGVKGVEFYGCSFKYNHTELDANLMALTEDNIGIYANDADVWVLPGYEYPDPMYEPCGEGCYELIPCSFDNLWYGIKAFNGGDNRRFYVDKAIFNNNNAGIYLSGYQQPTIISDTFMTIAAHMTNFQDDPFVGGIYMEDCSGYHVEGNLFTGNYVPGSASFYWTMGIYIKNSGTEDNEIYNNYFSHLHGGIVAEGKNRGPGTGLCNKCNDMNTNLNDFLVWKSGRENGTPEHGIKVSQGSYDLIVTAPAGNTFTYDTLPAHDYGGRDKLYFNYFNDALPFTYIHHQKQEDPLTYPLDSNYTYEKITRYEQQLLVYDSLSACPSNLGNNNYKSGYDPRLEMTFAEGYINQYRNLLDLLVDGGNTDELNFEVMTSMPNEALEMRQQLLDESPYLSDTVMKQAIYKEDVLPSAMLRDVLTANPQSAKSQDVLQSLNDRFDPLPDYMIEEIMQGREYLGAKEILESKLGYWQQIRAKAKNQLIRKFLSDTTILNPYDSLIALYENETDIPSKYRLAFCYFNNHQPEEALNLLDEIPSTYELSTYQNAVHQDYKNYFSVLKTMHDSTWSAGQIDSLSVNTLHEIMNNGYPLISGYARGLLVKGNFIDYTEQVYFPTNIKSYPEYHFTPHEVIVEKEDHLKLFPNPAWDYVIVYYNTSEYEMNGKLIMYDVNGKIIKTIVLSNQLNQSTISFKNLPNGVYMISLFVDDNLIESKKITKVGNK